MLALPAVGGAAGTVVLGGRKKVEKEKKGKKDVDGNVSLVLSLASLSPPSTPELVSVASCMLTIRSTERLTDARCFTGMTSS